MHRSVLRSIGGEATAWRRRNHLEAAQSVGGGLSSLHPRERQKARYLFTSVSASSLSESGSLKREVFLEVWQRGTVNLMGCGRTMHAMRPGTLTAMPWPPRR